MPKLKKPISFETTFNVYTADELLGEGGAGRVFGGVASDQTQIAIKVLAEERASTDKRRRFKNELAFQARNKHSNIVTVVDHGVIRGAEVNGPFYVMHRYQASLRDLIKAGIKPEHVMPLFSQILDGVEAAHLQGVFHRDLKPENILHAQETNTLAIADFGTAHFTEDLLVTQVQTGPTQRLANIMYAAPEQRTAGACDGAAADIYALGLMLNEMYTGAVPHGTNFRKIGQEAEQLEYLDSIVDKMLQQNPRDRPASISEVKLLIQRFRYEAVSLLRLSKIEDTVVKVGEIDEPLAITPPKLVDFDWNRGQLTLILDRPVTPAWLMALRRMGSYGSVMGKGPEVFHFIGNKATVSAQEYQVQLVVENFKNWLPMATQTLRRLLEQEAQKREATTREHLRQEKEHEEARLRVMRQIKI